MTQPQYNYQQTYPPKKNKTKTIVLTILAVVLGACLIGGVVSIITAGAAIHNASNLPATWVTPSTHPNPTVKKTAEFKSKSQEQAVLKAQQYVRSTFFSRKGLINQLKFEGFSTEDATFATDYLHLNYNTQAAGKAQEYVSGQQGFSKQSLIDQLEFEGYSTEQATYGATKAGF